MKEKRKIPISPKLIGGLFILSLFLFISQFFAYRNIDLNNNIDGSWQYSIARIRSTDQNLGKNINYTYGPLFEVIPTTPLLKDDARDFFIGASIFILITAGFIYSCCKSYEIFFRKNKFRYPALTVLAIIAFALLVTTYVDSIFYLNLLSTIYVLRNSENRYIKLFLYSAISTFAFYKVSFSISALVLIPLFTFRLPLTKKNTGKQLTEIVIFLLVFFMTFIILSAGNFANFINYLKIGILNSASYPEFMGLPFRENFDVFLVFTTVFYTGIVLAFTAICMSVYRKERHLNSFIFLNALLFSTSFFLYKQSIVRSDDHLFTLILFIPLLIGSIIVSTKYILTKKVSNQSNNYVGFALLFSVIIFVFSCATIYSNTQLQSYFKRRVTMLTQSATHNPLNYFSYTNTRQKAVVSEYSKGEILDEMTSFIYDNYSPDESVYFYGNINSITSSLSYVRDVKFMPFIQNYAAFPPSYFDSKYIEYLKNNDAQLVLVDEIEPSINERVPSHELTKFNFYLLSNYKIVFSDPESRLYLFEKVSEVSETCDVIDSINATSAEFIKIPEVTLPELSYIKLIIEDNDRLPEKLFELATKPLNLRLTLRTSEGVAVTKKTTNFTLENGINVSPGYLSITDFVNNAPFPLESISLSGGLDKNKKMVMQFSVCSFSD